MVDILNIPKLGRLEIVEIYDYYNQPVLFSCKDVDGNLYLVVAADESDEYETWLYANISVGRLKLIHSDKIDLHDAFADTEDGSVLQVKFQYNNSTPLAEFVKSNQLSEDMLPDSGEYLGIEVEKLSVFNTLEFTEIGKKEILDITINFAKGNKQNKANIRENE